MKNIIFTDMQYKSILLHKMNVKNSSLIEYSLNHDNKKLIVNDWIGKVLAFNFEGNIICKECNEPTPISYSQGFCYNCSLSSPFNSDCIINPELCMAHYGMGRDPEWEEKFHNTEHIVYLSFTGHIKVGVTSPHQVPIRWIDQGALQAAIIAIVPYRQLAGLIEVELKEFISDKTNWSNMLRSHKTIPSIEFENVFKEIKNSITENLKQYLVKELKVINLKYPMIESLNKVSSKTFDKSSQIEGTLIGLKGQYLIFKEGFALNIRKHTGYVVDIKIKENPVLSLF